MLCNTTPPLDLTLPSLDRCSLTRVKSWPRQIRLLGWRPVRRTTSTSVSLRLPHRVIHSSPSPPPFVGKVFELCLAEIEKHSPSGAAPEVSAGKCVIM